MGRAASGVRRWGPVLGLLAGLGGLGACTLAGPEPGPRAPRPSAPAAPIPEVGGGSMPDVRVGLVVAVPSVTVSGDRLELVDDAGRVHHRGPGPWTVTRAGAGVEARNGATVVGVEGSLVVRPVTGRVAVDGTGYRGAVLLRPGETGVTAVNLLDLESYLLGVVPLEIGTGRPAEELEAVKAQAIAARTYAVRQLGRREALGFDYHGSVLDQAYGGADAEDPAATRAVAETRGMILTHDGEPIEAYYHSTCGGRTAAPDEVWGGTPRPYLRSVPDERPDGGWYCEASSRFRWTEEWDEAALLASLSEGLGPVAVVEALEVTERSASGRAEALVVRTGNGERRVHGDAIRRVLRPEPGRMLNSTLIELEPRGGDRVTGLTVHGRGWGHGVGMCQTGALGRARAGQSYREILSTYYPGTRLVRLYR
ncbi:MAG: SpoIID/LytB domain-containing protein [Gemmatimonadota bacterium]